ncbi:hypothetical protein ACRCEU_00635, partial [Escherichia coli]
FLTAVVVHIILHWVVLRTFEKRAIASSRLWLQIITQNKLFHRLAFTLQGIIVNIQAVFWLQKGTEAADILTTCAQLWIMMYALLSVFSLLDVILNLAQKFPAASQLGTVAKLAMRQPFVLFKGLTFQKLCLPGAFRPGDHHNKMLRPGLCVV